MRSIVAGNWKMHKRKAEAEALLNAIASGLERGRSGVQVLVAPPFPFLELAVRRLEGTDVQVAAQNCHEAAQGAYTGEVSAGMLASLGVTCCIVGHSERRQFASETDTLVARKIAALLAEGLTPIYCCGEGQADRQAGRHQDVVSGQLRTALEPFSAEELERIVVAYEPVWAIGTGLNATVAQAQEMHAHIRGLLRAKAGAVADRVPILYGGSCKPDNAAELFAGADVNGGLIGGASLDAASFLELVRIAHRMEQHA